MPEASDWLNWDRYQSILISGLRQFSHFIIDQDLSPRAGVSSVLWRGRLHCEGGFEIAVDQRQAIRRAHGRIQVRTVRYSYQILQRGLLVRELVRYDNFHIHPGHADEHHVHRDGAIEHVGASAAPSLPDVLAEAEALWRLHGRPVPR